VKSKAATELFIAWAPFAIILASWLLSVRYVRRSPSAIKQFLDDIARKRPKDL
jgi:hypothetical protein